MSKSFLSFAFSIALVSKPLMANEQVVINACTQTVQNYAVYRDALNANAYAESFTEDGVFITPKATYEGRDEIRDYINQQSEDIQTLHHITTKQIIRVNDSEATGVIYVQVNFSKVSDGIGTIYQQGDAIYEDLYKYRDGKCEIAQRRLKILTLN